VISSVVRSYEFYETFNRDSIPLYFAHLEPRRRRRAGPPWAWPASGAEILLAGAAAPRPGGPGARAGPMAGPDTTRHWADAGAGAGPAPTTTAARAAVLVCGYTGEAEGRS
jgi:hypothetical protein